MFRFEDEPHDDGTCVHEAVESMLGEIVDVAMPSPFKARGLETVRMMIVQAYPAFFIGRRVSGNKRNLVVSVLYADISSGDVYPTRFRPRCAESRRRETMRRSMRTAWPALSINVSICRKEPTCPISTTFP